MKSTHQEGEQRVKESERPSRERGRLRDQVSLFQRFTEASGQGLGMADLEGHVTYANPTLCRLMGEERPEDPVGKHVRTYYPEEALPILENDILPAVFKEGEKTAEIPLLSRKGALTPTIQNVFLIRNDQGEPVCLANVITDITQRKEAEAHLRASEERHKALLQGAAEGIVVVDVETMAFKYANRALCRMLGYSEEEFKHMSIQDLHPEESLDHAVSEFKAQVRAEKTMAENIPCLRKDGATIFANINSAPLSIDGKECLVAFFSDITERKGAEDALRREKDQAQKYLDIAGVMLVVLDTDQRVRLANRRACEILGYEEGEILGRNWFDLSFPERSRDKTKKRFCELISGNIEPVAYCENPVLTKNNEARLIAWHHTVLKDDAGKIVATLSSGEDITEKRQAEDALRASEQRYRVLAENVLDGVGIIQNKTLVSTNHIMAAIFGYGKNEMAGMNPIELFGGHFKERFVALMQRLENGIPAESLQSLCVRKDGRWIWIEGHYHAVLWEGKPCLLTTVRDITERRLRELALHEERSRLEKENIELKSTLKDRYRFGDIIGKSPAMQEIYELIVTAGASDTSVVIHGESGTGKELVARAIHDASRRREKEFVSVNCGAIPETLVESEFFGYEKGAFTGALADKFGFLDFADGGTLFLDEAGDLNLNMQVKLLRAIEGGGHIPIGSNRTRTSDFRLIIATNKNLADLVKKGLIREDFFYRINVIPITLPPLRDRREDIGLLIEYFLSSFGNGKSPRRIPGHVVDLLSNYHWPGNVRELQNALHRYLTLGRLDLGDPAGNPQGLAIGVPRPEPTNLRLAVADFERSVIEKALSMTHWHKAKTATTLGIDRKTLFRKMQAFGLN
ncbi:MAG: PAS domain S-box protein [Thermodesulfobacteriota bacterium]|nr:PAS domain S-box protein [Thermodesulfobacteriota bacterium]